MAESVIGESTRVAELKSYCSSARSSCRSYYLLDFVKEIIRTATDR